MAIKMFVVMKRKLSYLICLQFIGRFCLSLVNEVTDTVSLSKFNADVDSGKWNRNRNAMFTQDEMTTGMSYHHCKYHYLSMLSVNFVYIYTMYSI